MLKNPMLARLSNQIVSVAPDHQQWFESCLQQIVGHADFTKLNGDNASAANDDTFWYADDDWRAAYRPYVVKGGILQVPVFGVLLNRFPFQIGRYATGYTYIQKALERGLADPDVKGIAFLCDTPGGEVAGCFELQDKIYAARGQKPLRAFAAESAYSAGYAIASATDSIVTTRTGGVGSVGVVTMHVDYSKAVDAAGIVITFVFAGDHKVDGNPYEPLPKAVKARIQKRIDKSYAVFTGLVARNRNMSVDDVVGTQADCYIAEDAVAIGFADKVQIFEEALEAFAADPSDESQEEDDMATFTQEQHDAAVAAARSEGAASASAANQAAVAAASKAAKDRIVAITSSEVAKKRPAAAMAAAMETDMTAEQAASFLAKLPEEKAETAAAPTPAAPPAGQQGSHFDAAMARGNPNVGAGGGSDTTGEGAKAPTADEIADRALNHYRGETGRAAAGK